MSYHIAADLPEWQKPLRNTTSGLSTRASESAGAGVWSVGRGDGALTPERSSGWISGGLCAGPVKAHSEVQILPV